MARSFRQNPPGGFRLTFRPPSTFGRPLPAFAGFRAWLPASRVFLPPAFYVWPAAFSVWRREQGLADLAKALEPKNTAPWRQNGLKAMPNFASWRRFLFSGKYPPQTRSNPLVSLATFWLSRDPPCLNPRRRLPDQI
jgi:hypothetical protein